MALKTFKPPPVSAKAKGKERARTDILAALYTAKPQLRQISDDEFEMVMTVFEAYTAEKCPLLQLDLSKLPTLEDLLPSFDPDSPFSKLALPILPDIPLFEANDPNHPSHSKEWNPSNPYHNLSALKPLAPLVYPWWVIRRKDRDGKNVVAALNFDEANENDPYVCFRRREVKLMRKTRKTDALHIEKLVRLRTELESAAKLLELLAQRERTKRTSISQERACWQVGQGLMDLKRHWGIPGPHAGVEDDELVFATRKREEEVALAADARAKKKRKTEEQNLASGLGIKLTRKPRPSEDAGSANATPGANGLAQGQQQQQAHAQPQGLGIAILERVQAVHAYIEREVLRKAEADLGYEEASDTAFQPLAPSFMLRAFRTLQSDPSSSIAEGNTFSDAAEDAPALITPASSGDVNRRAGRPPSFRRRVGRGGRIFLDRRLPAPSPVPASLAEYPSASSLSEVDQVEALLTSREPANRRLTGPFAFSADVRPMQLSSTTQQVSSLALSTGPFASSSGSASFADEAARHISDASSTSSDWSDRSKSSNASSTGAASTQPTDVEDIDAMDVDKEAEHSEKTNSREHHHHQQHHEEEREPLDLKAEAEKWSKLCERWRYDDDAGRWAGLGLTGLGGMEDDEEAVVDDYDQRFLRYRMGLLEESDLYKLQTDLTHIMAAQAAVEVPMPPPPPPPSAIQPVPATTHKLSTATTPQQAALLSQSQSAQAQSQQAVAQAQAQAQAAAAMAAASNSGRAAPSAAAAAANANSLLALQQQQQHFQLALQQQQQRAQIAAVASAAARSNGSTPGTPRANSVSSARNSVSGQGNAQTPHPLSQAFSANGAAANMTPQQIQQQAALLALQQQAVAARGANGQAGLPNQLVGVPMPNGFQMLPNASGQLQAQMQPPRSTPSPAGGIAAGSSPDMNGQQAQQRMHPQNAALLLKQQQQLAAMAAAVNNGQNMQNGHQLAPTTSTAQMLAMQQALAQNPQLQLKLPANRAMQLGGQGMSLTNQQQMQAALQLGQHNAIMQQLLAKQVQQQARNNQQAAQQQGRGSPQLSQQFPNMLNMSGGGPISPLPPGVHMPSPAMAAAQLQQRAQGSPALAASSPQMGARGTPVPGGGGTPQRQGSQGYNGYNGN